MAGLVTQSCYLFLFHENPSGKRNKSDSETVLLVVYTAVAVAAQ